MKPLFFLSLFFLSQGFAQTQFSGKATDLSWGGYWWSMENAELALGWHDGNGRRVYSASKAKEFDECLSKVSSTCKKLIQDHLKNKGIALSPLMKFDLWVKKQVDAIYPEGTAANMYSRATHNELKIHYIQGPEHPHYEARGYAGKCTGWALSNMDFNEPTSTKTIDGITFTPADIKGILATIYNGAQFFVPDELALGNAYRASGPDRNESYYADPAPHVLILAMEKHIKGEGKIITADMEPSDGVWNHPLHAYNVRLGPSKNGKVAGTMTLYFADDEVEIDEVFSTQRKRADLKERSLEFELTVPENWNGRWPVVKSSRWTGNSKDMHPDSLILGLESGWRNTIYEYKNTDMKLEVNYQLIKKVNLGRGYQVIVNELLKKYYN